MYADPVADLLDRKGVFRSRLFREACVFFDGNYVKDLTRLGRDLSQTLIIDNSPISYAFHPENAVCLHFSLIYTLFRSPFVLGLTIPTTLSCWTCSRCWNNLPKPMTFTPFCARVLWVVILQETTSNWSICSINVHTTATSALFVFSLMLLTNPSVTYCSLPSLLTRLVLFFIYLIVSF